MALSCVGGSAVFLLCSTRRSPRGINGVLSLARLSVLLHREIWKWRERRGIDRVKVGDVPLVLELRRISMG